MKKTIILTIMAMVLCFGLATAFSGLGTGIVGDPYQITNCTALQEIQDNLSANYAVMNIIDCTETGNWNNATGFVPITLFTGTLEGGHYAIDGLFINLSLTDNVGLFSNIGSGGHVNNIKITNAYVNAYRYIGILVGQLDGTITNCSSSGIVNGFSSLGGLVGVHGSGLTIISCHSSATVTASNVAAGGLVGDNYFTIRDSYATGSVSGVQAVGGLVGFESGGLINNSYSTGFVTASINLAGGLLGTNAFGGIIENSYWDNETSGQNTSAGGTGLSTADMKTQATFTGWDFVNTWIIEEGNDYPEFIYDEEAPGCTLDTDCGLCQYCNIGTCENQPYNSGHNDFKNECTFEYLSCTNAYHIWTRTGACNGMGSCNDFTNTNVNAGSVCQDGNNTAPSISNNCGIWYDCITNSTTATEYYVGYTNTNPAPGLCNDTNWVATGNTLNITAGYRINQTEHSANCSIELIPCIPNWTCSGLSGCTPLRVKECQSITDNNNCAENFTGSLSDYNEACSLSTTSTSHAPRALMLQTPTTTFQLLPTGEVKNPFIQLWINFLAWLTRIGVKI